MSMSWYFDLTEKSVDKDANTSVVTAELWVKITSQEYSTTAKSYTIVCDGESASGYASVNYAGSAYLDHCTVCSRDFTVTHNADGTKQCTASVSYDSEWGAKEFSKTITLTKIARASTLKVSNGTLGTEQTITMTKANRAYLHTLYYKIAGSSTTHTLLTSSPDTTRKVTFPISYAKYAPSAKSVSITVYLKTVDSSGNQIGTVQSTTISQAIPSSVKPSCTVTISEVANQGHIEKYGGLVSGKSNVAITCAFTGAYGSTLASSEIVFDGVTSSGDVSSQTVTGSGSKKATCVVKDSRGYSSSKATSNAVNILEYDAPSAINLEVARVNAEHEEDDSGVYVRYTISYRITALGNGNSKSLRLQYKLQSATSWSSISLTASKYTGTDIIGFTSAQFDANKTYDMRLRVTDDFGSSYTYATLATAECLVDAYVDSNGNMALTIGGAAEKTGLVSKIPAEFVETVTLGKEPTADSHAATKKYADTKMRYVSASRGYASDSVTISSGTWTTLRSITLGAGNVYVLNFVVRFPKNTTGVRGLIITESESATSGVNGATNNFVVPNSYTYTYVHLTSIVVGTGQTIYLRAFQNSGSEMASCQVRTVSLVVQK